MLMAFATLMLLGSSTMVAPQTIYDFTVRDIDGKEVPLKKFKGKAIVVVNVASKCGLTPQYKGLEELYKKYKAKGLVVLGFPANNFAGQEPGTEAEIKEFCTLNYGVSFPMFSKVSVNGSDRAPLYAWLIAQSDRPKDDIEWNFAKFVIGRDGKLLKRLTPKDTPEGAELQNAVQSALR